MELFCIFESNSEELQSIWDRGISFLSEECTPGTASLLASPCAFLCYLRAMLCLRGDREEAKTLLKTVLASIQEQEATGERLNTLSVYPLALECYHRYTGDAVLVSQLIPALEGLFAPYWESTMQKGTFVTSALLLGALLCIQRLRGVCGLPVELGRQTRMSEMFHSRFFLEKENCYVDEQGEQTPLTAVLPAALGFVHEGGHGEVKRLLIEEAFRVPRPMRLFLYDAMIAEELFDLLFPTVLEGGVSRGGITYAELASLDCILEYLCGVDMEMLGKGIQCAAPHLPAYVSYRLTVPAGPVFLTFESEDLPDE